MSVKRLKTNSIILLVIFIGFTRAMADSLLVSDLPIDPKVNFALIPVKPGAIQPEGWLRDWAKSAATGITGHLDEWSPTYGMAWKGVGFKARGVQANGTGWPLEQCAYWLDGLVRLAYILDDPRLIRKAQSRLDPVVEGALKGTHSFIHWCPIEKSKNGFNNWAHSHMGRALVAYYQATGNKHILDALIRVYSSFPITDPELHFNSVCGSVNLDPLLETYCMSGEPRLIENALNYSKTQDFISMVNSYKERALITGHVVIFYENIRVPALVYPWTGNKDHLTATINILQQAEKQHGLPMGLISGEEHAAGIGSTRNVETCNVAAGAWTLNWLLRITGERKYADQLEKIFFNAGPSPASRDFSTMCYYQSPNRLAAGFLSEAPQAPGGYEAYHFTKLGHSVLCCVGNLNRVIPNYIMHMWMKTLDGGIAATLYGPSRLLLEIANGVGVEVLCQTDYPFKENIRMVITPSRSVRFPLYLRIPVWCVNPEVQVNKEHINVRVNKQGFVVLTRTWKKGDVVSLRFPMKVSVIQGRETDYPKEPYFTRKATRSLAKHRGINNPYTSVFYGPLLFALPVKDNTPNEIDTDVLWNYALDVSPKDAEERIKVIHQSMPRYWHWQLDAPLKLRVPARQFQWLPDKLQPLPPMPIGDGTRETIELVPYGVTKFRISMFPVTEEAWAEE